MCKARLLLNNATICRSFSYSLLKIILATALTLSPLCPTWADNTEDTSGMLEKLRSQINTLRSSLSATHDEKKSTEQQLRESEIKIGEISHSLKKLGTQLRQQTTMLDELQLEKTGLNENLRKQYDVLAQQIRAAYIMGRQGHLKVFLNPKDPAAMGRSLTYFDYLNQSKTDQIKAINKTLTKIDLTEKDINEKASRLLALQDEQLKRKLSMEQQRQIRQKILQTLNMDIINKEQHLARLLENEKELSNLLTSIQKTTPYAEPEATDDLPFSTLYGELPWPSRGPILKHFGDTRAGKLKWQGTMIDVEDGQDVNAIYYGHVIFADWLRGFGLLIILDHGEGYMSLYGHNQSLYKTVGDRVKPGDVIAITGDSGGRTTPGLYFEIRHNGQADNPALWCRKEEIYPAFNEKTRY